MLVIAQPASRSTRRIALDLLMRVVAIALAALLILVLLPAIAQAAG
jgi:hypothetical protein